MLKTVKENLGKYINKNRILEVFKYEKLISIYLIFLFVTFNIKELIKIEMGLNKVVMIFAYVIPTFFVLVKVIRNNRTMFSKLFKTAILGILFAIAIKLNNLQIFGLYIYTYLILKLIFRKSINLLRNSSKYLILLFSLLQIGCILFLNVENLYILKTLNLQILGLILIDILILKEDKYYTKNLKHLYILGFLNVLAYLTNVIALNNLKQVLEYTYMLIRLLGYFAVVYGVMKYIEYVKKAKGKLYQEKKKDLTEELKLDEYLKNNYLLLAINLILVLSIVLGAMIISNAENYTITNIYRNIPTNILSNLGYFILPLVIMYIIYISDKIKKEVLNKLYITGIFFLLGFLLTNLDFSLYSNLTIMYLAAILSIDIRLLDRIKNRRNFDKFPTIKNMPIIKRKMYSKTGKQYSKHEKRKKTKVVFAITSLTIRWSRKSTCRYSKRIAKCL